jgi:hypothetical protein
MPHFHTHPEGPTQPDPEQIAKLVHGLENANSSFSSLLAKDRALENEVKQLQEKIKQIQKEHVHVKAKLKSDCPHVWHNFRLYGGEFWHYYGTCAMCGQDKDTHRRTGWDDMVQHNTELAQTLV